MAKEAILEGRRDYYGLSGGERTSYMLDLFRSREESVKDAGQMIFQNVQVCKQAFWQLYGFVKQSFYNYERQYKDGAKVGLHGNTGTKKIWGDVLMA